MNADLSTELALIISENYPTFSVIDKIIDMISLRYNEHALTGLNDGFYCFTSIKFQFLVKLVYLNIVCD